MKGKGKFFKGIKTALSVLLVAVALVCVIARVPQVFSNRDTALAAAAFTLTDGRVYAESGTEPHGATLSEPMTTVAATEEAPTQPRQRDKSGYYDSFGNHDGEEKLAVDEKTILPDGVAVEGCYLKNNTDIALDFTHFLHASLPFAVESGTGAPQVLVYHTHTGEAYLDEDVDFFYGSYPSRTDRHDFSVAAVGDAIVAALQRHGVAALHDTTVHDASYNGSYDRSAQTVRDYLERYPSLKVVLDIHRDALGTEACKVKTVFEHDGKKAAQIMILAGCDPDGERGFDHWMNNLTLALKLQHTAELSCPGMTRPLDFGYFAYNEYLCDGSLLIEVGTDANAVDEAVYAGQLLGDALAKVLTA